jgi:hypothetical protein
MNENKDESVQLCPACGRRLPILDKDGGHNFHPAMGKGGEIIQVCIECKTKKIKERPAGW